jgi:hypothetical protein
MKPSPNGFRKATPQAAEAAQTQPKNDAHPAAAFLRLLGKDPAETYFRSIQPGTTPKCFRGFGPDTLGRANASQSIYFVTGNAIGASGKGGGVLASDIATCPALFTEWDDRPIEWQVQAWKEQSLPEPTVQVLTGGKSVHCYWLLSEPMPPDQWRVLQARLIAHCGSDQKLKDPCRLMRLPGFAYINKATGKPSGQMTEVIRSSTTRYSPDQIAACLPAVEAPAPASGPSRKTAAKASSKASNLPPRPLEQIEAAAQFIPERVVGGDTYEECRNALCGCAAALAEAGVADPDGAALDLLASKWPDRGDAEQVLGSTTTREAASFWRIAEAHGFDLSRSKRRRPPPPPHRPEPPQEEPQEAQPAPFQPMGQTGDAFVYRTASGELVTLPRSRHTSVCLVSLAPLAYWEALYPGKTGPNWLAAASSLFEQQRRLPPFSLDRIRGRGTWMDDDRTVLHLGDRLLVDGRPSQLHHPQTAYVYDRRPSLPDLGPEPLADEAGLQVMQFLRGAGWRDGMDHLLLAGAIVLGPVGNALRLRPQLVVTAPRGAGKTEGVLKPAEALMGGPDMVLFAKGWTASAVRQSLDGDVLPVICDEWENAAKTPQRRDEWGELLRVAYDGGECGRGTPGQVAIRQRVSSAFILAGINVEGMDDASRSRGVIVQKGILSQSDIRQQVLAAQRLAVPDLGRRLVRRTLANLPTLLQNAETIQQALDGMDSRRADVHAHLLAGALLLVTTERLDSVATAQSWLARIGWKADEAAEEDLQQDSEGRRCLDRLLRHTVRWDELGDRSREITVSELIRKALSPPSVDDTRPDEVSRVLGRLGVKVAAGQPWAIYVAKRCSEAIYRGTTWADGNHLSRLLDLDGAEKSEAWFPVSRKQRCVWIPQKHVDETEPAPASQQEVGA